MERVIWKYELPPLGINREINIPNKSIYGVCNVGLDAEGTPCIWFDLVVNSAGSSVLVAVLPTGMPFTDNKMRYRGTYVDPGSGIVGHVYISSIHNLDGN